MTHTHSDPDRLHIVVAPHLLLLEANKVLLGKRKNTGYADGMWHVPGGHTEHGENIVDALIREMKEELAIQIPPHAVRFAHGVYAKEGSEQERFQVFFHVETWEGEIQNNEPDKCEKLEWFPISRIPENTVGYTRQAIREALRGERFSLFGWEKKEKK